MTLLKTITSIFKDTFKSFQTHDPFTRSAATAYYALFSFPALVIIIMAVASIWLQQTDVEQNILANLTHVMGEKTANDVYEIIKRTERHEQNKIAMIVGLGTLLLGATGLFAHLQHSLNLIWGIEVKKKVGLVGFLITRALSLGVIVAIGFLMMASVMITALIGYFGDWIASTFSIALHQIIVQINFLLSFVSISILFALIYKILPDVMVDWLSALWGGFIAALLFIAGEYAVNVFFDLMRPESAFGAAGSLVVLLIWLSYTGVIILLGAEFSKTIQLLNNDGEIKPTTLAERIKYRKVD